MYDKHNIRYGNNKVTEIVYDKHNIEYGNSKAN